MGRSFTWTREGAVKAGRGVLGEFFEEFVNGSLEIARSGALCHLKSLAQAGQEQVSSAPDSRNKESFVYQRSQPHSKPERRAVLEEMPALDVMRVLVLSIFTYHIQRVWEKKKSHAQWSGF